MEPHDSMQHDDELMEIDPAPASTTTRPPKRLPHPPRQRPLYENCSVYAPDGVTLLFRCARKKVNWYLSRDLARPLGDTDPPSIALTFTPAGSGRAADAWYLESKTPHCVICGTPDSLITVSVVPHQYRRHLPLCVKSHSNLDTLPVCIPCHAAYDAQVRKACATLAAHYGVPLEGTPWIAASQQVRSARKAAGALLNPRAKIPEQACAELWGKVRAVLGDGEIAEHDLRALAESKDVVRGPGFVEHGEAVVRAVLAERARAVFATHGVPDTLEMGTGQKPPSANGAHGPTGKVGVVRPVPLPADQDPVVAFVVMWRKHFLAVARPQCMSLHYDVHADVFNH
ncbi:hypothetical protein H9P43_009636 [Blastocladiella emersonii ATCC 22665]|nr:hypothetical protein H9P43_009636 [Blastocladiella emersonii ATCC 22665]